MRRKALPIAAALGNTVEWFDFAVYGYFAHAIGAAFFPTDRPSLQMVSAFGVFAVGYLMRPVGGLLLGPIGDQWGRRVLLLISVLVMGCCSLAIALLPTMAQIGPSAAVLLVLLRMLQGLSVGAEYSGAISWSVETAPGHRRAFFSSITASGATVASLLAPLLRLGQPRFLRAIEAGAWRLPLRLGSLSFVVLHLRRASRTAGPRWRAAGGPVPIAVSAVASDGSPGGERCSGDRDFLSRGGLLRRWWRPSPAGGSPNGLTALIQVFSLLLSLLAGYLADRWVPLSLLRRSLAVLMLALVPGVVLLGSGSISGFVGGRCCCCCRPSSIPASPLTCTLRSSPEEPVAVPSRSPTACRWPSLAAPLLSLWAGWSMRSIGARVRFCI